MANALNILDNSSADDTTEFLPSDYEFFTTSVSIASQVFAISIIIITDLVGNLLMCYAIYKTPSLRTVTNIYTVNLGIVDLSVGILILPMWIVSTIHLSWPLPSELCHITAFMTVLLLTCSIYTLAGISLDRYFCICYPLRYPSMVTRTRVLLSVGIIWIISTLLAGAPLVGWGNYSFKPQTIPICNPEWVAEISYSIVLIILGMALPLAAVLFSYICIIMVARRQAKRIAEVQGQLQNPTLVGNSERSEKQSGKRRFFSGLRRINSTSNFKTFSVVTKNLKTLKTVFIVVGAFFLCWGPYVFLNFWSVNNELKAVPYVADLLTTFLAFTNSSLNPVIFTALNRDFRLSIMLIVRRILCFWRKDMVFSFRHRQEWGSRYASLMEARARRRRDRQNKVFVLDPEECCAVDSQAVSPACTESTTDGVPVILNPSTLPQSQTEGGNDTDKPSKHIIQTKPDIQVNNGEVLPGTVS